MPGSDFLLGRIIDGEDIARQFALRLRVEVGDFTLGFYYEECSFARLLAAALPKLFDFSC